MLNYKNFAALFIATLLAFTNAAIAEVRVASYQGKDAKINAIPNEVGKVIADTAKQPAEVLPPYGFAGTDIPAILSQDDVETYKQMFRLQRQTDRDGVVKLLPKLHNDLLMGSLVAERLLHPRTKVSYADLRLWLSKYHDQAPAEKIYQLANSREPAKNSIGHHKPSTKVLSLARYNNPDAFEGEPEQNVKNTKKRSSLLRTLKTYRVKGQFVEALKIIAKSSTKETLGTETWHEVSLTLARSMMNKDYFEEAQKLAEKVAEESNKHRPGSLWVAGFSAYRQGKTQEAARIFRRLAYVVPNTSQYYAKAAWWAAKSYEKLGEKNMAGVFVNMASQHPTSFYGQLALEKLGKTSSQVWKAPALKAEHKQVLFKNPAIQRVIALTQIGEHALAQEELKTAYESIPYEWDESLLALSVRLNLPATALTLAYNLNERGQTFLEGLYPVSNVWYPRGGYKVDKALITAIIKQESAFQPTIKSRAGARGLMQVMPATASFIRGKQGEKAYPKSALLNPYISMQLGQDYLIMLNEKLNGNVVHMIAAYNAGPGNVDKWLTKNPEINNDPALFIESIPFAETRKYVEKVMSNYWMYQKQFGHETPTLSAMSNNKWPTKIKLSLK